MLTSLALQDRSTVMLGAGIGAAIGAVAFGAIVATGASLTFPWWLVGAIPSGVLAGATAGHWIRHGARIPIRAVLASALVADVAGAAFVSLLLTVEAYVGPYPATGNLVVEAFLALALGLLTVGWLAFVVLVPIASIGAVILRRLAP